MQNIRNKVPLKKLISEHFTKDKFFYSFEITPKENFQLDVSKLRTHPLFVNLSWIGDYNLKYGSISSSPAMILKKNIENDVNVVTTVTCFRLEDKHIDEILSDENNVQNFSLFRGGVSDVSQKYKSAKELISLVRDKTKHLPEDVTIFAGCYPESKDPVKDLDILKDKIEAGVDVLISQTIFSASKFCEFVANCRKAGIKIPIIPGIYIPYKPEQLDFMVNLTKSEVPRAYEQKFKDYSNDPENFQKLGLTFATELIQEIQDQAPEHIPGYHFYTLNSLSMLNKLTQTINFSDVS